MWSLSRTNKKTLACSPVRTKILVISFIVQEQKKRESKNCVEIYTGKAEPGNKDTRLEKKEKHCERMY